jgi:hypothetical protein
MAAAKVQSSKGSEKFNKTANEPKPKAVPKDKKSKAIKKDVP